MPITYTTLIDAQKTDLPVLVTVMGVPSPWGEAAKGLFHVADIDYLALPFDGRDDDLARYTNGANNAPCLVIKGEKPRHTSLDILIKLDDIADADKKLLPTDPMDRAFALGLIHELIGENSLTWARRVELIHTGLKGDAGFPAPMSQYLAGKYGATHMTQEEAVKRTGDLLTLFYDRLISQSSIASAYLIGHTLTAVDIYLATAMALFGPLPQDKCAMHPKIRPAFEAPTPDLPAGVLETLLAHRDQVYAHHLELPLNLGLAS